MHDLIIAALAAFTGGVVVHVTHRVRQDEPLPDALDMPALYTQRNGALYGRPSVAPAPPGLRAMRIHHAARMARIEGEISEARRGK